MKLYYVPICFVVASCYAQETTYFSPEVLKAGLGDQAVDLSYLEKGLDTVPGTYPVDVYVNQRAMGSMSVEFRESNGQLLPVLSLTQLKELGINTDDRVFSELEAKAEVFPLNDYIGEVTQYFDVPMQRLDLTIPQLYMKSSRLSYDIVSPDLWDNGIPAAMLGYNLTGAHYKNKFASGSDNSNLYLGINGQFNYGAWRLYTTGSFILSRTEFDGQSQTNHSWDFWNTYLQRDLPFITSRLRLGDINTPGDILDSISMRGVSLLTNEEMLSVTERSFMPNISGVANSFAQVIIRQNGRVVYQTSVAPGPWKLDNLPTFGNEGDLEVITKEADGTERVEFYPYSSVPLMLREGQWRYNVNLGHYYQRNQDTDRPWFAMGTVSYGLPHDITLYGGSLLSDDYQSVVFGSALSLGAFGAISADVTQAKTRFEDDHEDRGGAYRVRYSKTLLASGTTVNLVNYRYRSGDFWTFQEANDRTTHPITKNGRQKDRWQFSLTQSFNQWGTLTASGDRTTYRNGQADTKTWQVGYNVNVKHCNVYLNYTRAYTKYNHDWQPEHRVMLNLDIPFNWLSSHPSSVSNNISAAYQGSMHKSVDGDHRYQQKAIVRGLVPEWDLNWQIEQTFGDKSERSSSAMVGYSGDQIGGSLSFTTSHNMDTYQLAANGSLLLHDSGITASARAYDSIALVDVGGLEGVKINKGFNVRTDSNGYAVLTTLINYAQNEVVIDPSSLPEGALLLDGTNQNIYPTSGAVVKVKFPVRLGKQAIFQLLQSEGQPLPFGAQVVLLDEKGQEDSTVTGIVGDDGCIYLSALPQGGKLSAKWQEEGQEQQVEYHYALPQKDEAKTVKDFEEIPEITLLPIENQPSDAAE